ncbi:hypothetical protein PP713_08515 [Mycobacterium sp. CSUR Q5927]|nr:hypothetical protein [Mycobacterium sp. CSUR Q5927]
MTPRHPYRRRWRETWHPLLWLVAVGALLAVALGFSVPPAGAVPVASPGEQYAADHSADICMALDTRPTIPGVEALLTSLRHEQGLDMRESAVAVVTSVVDNCRIHENLLRQFVAHYQKGRAA